MRLAIAFIIFVLLAFPAYAACSNPGTGKLMKVIWDSSGSATITSENTTTIPAVVEGAIIFDSSDQKLKFCNGTNWLPVVSENPVGELVTYVMNINTSAPFACTGSNRGTVALNNVNNALVGPSFCVCAVGGWKKMDGLGTSCVWNFP